MTLWSVIWGSPGWLVPALALVVAALVVLAWSYFRAPASFGLRSCAGALKAAGVVALGLCLLEPLLSRTRPRPGANLFVLLADVSRSLEIRDPRAGHSRAEILREHFARDAPWQTRLSQDFDVRRYCFAERVELLDDEGALSSRVGASAHPTDRLDTKRAGGTRSSLRTALVTIARRFRNRPLAGILVFTDGNATDLPSEAVDWSDLPPVYPVPLGEDSPARDIRVGQVSVSQTSFEQTPVTIRASVQTFGYDGQNVVVQLLDASGEILQANGFMAGGDNKTGSNPAGAVRPVGERSLARGTGAVPSAGDGARPEPPIVEGNESGVVRFRFRPQASGTSFYQVRASAESELGQFARPQTSVEATLANNRKLVTVQRPGGPFRVLYVSGRPNWEFKFLRRAVEADREVELVGLIRIAKREPKFAFLGRAGDSSNPLFKGFEDAHAEDVERYDQPVLIRIGTRDEAELRDGFPKAADELYQYDAVILDDLEADFFTQDQMLLLQRFVSRRGGGLLMLGGAESFQQGDYRRTPVAELLPIYLDRQPPAPPGARYRLALSREGWLQPWVRLRDTEPDERARLESMPAFTTFHRVRGIKPGATVLANAIDGQGKSHPALVVGRFGRGRAAALMFGDLWRWELRREAGEENELAKAWRQTVRWLVADVPRRVEIDVRREDNKPGGEMRLTIQVADPEYKPMDNASVDLRITMPDGKPLQLRAVPSDEQAGSYVATYVPRQPGPFRAKAVVTAADGSKVGETEAGWTAEPEAEEFRRLVPDLALLEQIAAESGGQLVPVDHLDSFVASLPNRKIPVVDPWMDPLWHRPLVFLLAIACLVGEWALRRWKGLP